MVKSCKIKFAIVLKISKRNDFMKSKLVILITILFLTGCGAKKTEERPQPVATNKVTMESYPYANSTDIYTSTARYALDGTSRRMINLRGSDGLERSILYVSDEWLYYYVDDDGTGTLKRIPLHKGRDKRDIVDIEKAENIRDTQYENGFTVVDNYYAGISYGTVGILYNMDTGETVRQKVPEDLSYSKEEDTEEKYWGVLEQGKDWVLWENAHGIMLQMIPSCELRTIENRNYAVAHTKNENCIIYSTDKQSCTQYDAGKNEKNVLFGEKQIRNAICLGMGLSESELGFYRIDNFMVKDKKIYMQLKVKITKKDIVEHKYVILSQVPGEEERLVFDQTLNTILKNNSKKRQKKKKKKVYYDNIRFVANMDYLWFMAADSYYCYDEKTGVVKEIDRNDSEWNVSNAIWQDGLDGF